MAKQGTILVVDDNKGILTAVQMLLGTCFEKVITISTPNKIKNTLHDENVDVVLLDMNFSAGINSGNEGLFWLSEIKKAYPSIQVVLFTAYADIDLAVRGIKEGATDFVVKPWDNAKLLETLQAAYQIRSANHKGNEGLFWLSEIKKAYPSIQVVLFTAYADIDLAVRGIKEGATDFVVKPWDNAKLLETLQAAYQIRSANHKGGVGNKQLVSKESGMFWGDSNAMQQLRMLIEKVAKTDANLLITGENGTGKEMLAREIHLLSPRKDEAMVPVDMGAITETLFESELFGHVKGAFTDARTDRPGKFEVANNGSLFLDEIGNLSYHLQAKLLTALQRRSIVRVGSNTPIPINIRLICATNRDLQEMVQKEQFREDLLYRINTIHVEIPPLRERPEDIVPLTEIFITKYTNIYGKKPMALTDDAKEKLKAQPWLGNIRELEHTVEKAIIIADGDTLDGGNFDFPRKREAPVKNDITTLEEMEYTMIKAAMDKFGGNLSLVANQLGISRQTLYNKIKRYEL